MCGEKNLEQLLKSMKPEHILGHYVFCKVETLENVNLSDFEDLFLYIARRFYKDLKPNEILETAVFTFLPKGSRSVTPARYL